MAFMNIKRLIRWNRKLFFKQNCRWPEQITFFVTNKCNLSCSHCFYWRELNKKAKEELSLEEIKKISQNMGDFAFLSLTGGEPFLRKDIAQIATIFHKNNHITRLSIPTNGLLTDKIINSTKKILEANPDLRVIIKISLDGPEKTHDQIRGMKGCFKTAVKTYEKLKALKKSYPNLRVGTLTTISTLNQQSVDQLYDFIKNRLKPDHVGLNLIRGKVKDSQIKNIDIKLYKQVYQKILKDSSDRFFKLYKKAVFNLITKIIDQNKFQTACFAGILSAVIYSNGDLYPCELLNKKMGNLRDANYDFKKIWAGHKARQIRRDIKKDRCFCRHECNLPLNIFFNLNYYPKLMIDFIKPLKPVIVLIITGLIFFLIFQRINIKETSQALGQAKISLLILAMVISLSANLLGVTDKWKRIIRALGYSLPYRGALEARIGSYAIRGILPLKSGEAARIGYLKKFYQVPLKTGVVSSLLSMIFNLLALIAFIGLGFLAGVSL